MGWSEGLAVCGVGVDLVGVGVGLLLLGSLGPGDNLELVGIKLEEGGGMKVLGPIRKTSPYLLGC